MLSLKKVYRDELLQIALILSLLRGESNPYLENDLFNYPRNYDLDNGTSWRSLSPTVLRSHFVNPKSLDSVLLNYERELFADLNLLGRYNGNNYRHPDVTAYLLNIDRTNTPLATQDVPSDIIGPQSNANEDNNIPVSNNEDSANSLGAAALELTQEDMDLIEVLWKQDVDLGFSLDVATGKVDKTENSAETQNATASTTNSVSIDPDDVEKLNSLKAINEKEKNKDKPSDENDENMVDPWAGFDYTIDTETGEYVIKNEELSETLTGADCGPSCDLPLGDLSLPLPEFLLDEALRLVELDDSPQEGIHVEELENLVEENNAEVNKEGASSNASDLIEDIAVLPSKETEENLEFLDEMIQTSQFHHPHHRAFQSRMPFVRTMSMEQRWQDLANLLSLPSPGDTNGMPHPFTHHHPLHNYSHPHPHPHTMGYGPEATRGVLLHNATLTPPMGDINATVPYSNIGGTNLGNAVATSMNLTNSSEPMGEPNSTPHYKLEPSHDMMYYQNSTSELNQTDGFLSSILNDEDLQLMDMAMNEGMYTMRMLDSNNSISNLTMGASGHASMSRTDMERMDTSSDSAVSSMGSERVPSLSDGDGEWCDGGSDSGHTAGDHYVTDYQTKYRPYDYTNYASRQHATPLSATDAARLPPVAQKKHQMFGKRYLQEQGIAASAVSHQTPVKYDYREPSATSYNSTSQSEGSVGPKPSEMKYSCSMEFGRHNHVVRNSLDHIQHNHTYHLPVEGAATLQRPVSRDKGKSRKAEDEHLTRDEKRARALSVPISVDDIINLPMDEFNERLSKYDLSEAQLSLIRDIRRRGKNKVAAQNCRKRKLDQILSLADEVKDMRDRKMRLINEHEMMTGEVKRMKDKYQHLYKHVFQNLRDAEGNQYSPYQYSLQTSADGSVLVVPRTNSTLTTPDRKDPPTQGQKE